MYFMAVKSVFDIKRFKDVKFWVEHISIYRNPETFFKISFPPCASKKLCMYMCYHILQNVLKWLAGTRGGRCSAAQKLGAEAHKMPFLPNKKLMTVMKVSRTNLLNCFVFCASLI